MNKGKIVLKDIENIDIFINKSYISDNLKDQIISSDIAILPIEGFGNYKGPLFPTGTEMIYLYLKKNLPPDYKLEIAIDAKDYKELSLNHAIIDIGIFILSQIYLPFFLNLLANYISNKFSSKDNIVKVKFILKDDLKFIDYEGPVDNFKIISKELKKISKNE